MTPSKGSFRNVLQVLNKVSCHSSFLIDNQNAKASPFVCVGLAITFHSQSK